MKVSNTERTFSVPLKTASMRERSLVNMYVITPRDTVNYISATSLSFSFNCDIWFDNLPAWSEIGSQAEYATLLVTDPVCFDLRMVENQGHKHTHLRHTTA